MSDTNYELDLENEGKKKGKTQGKISRMRNLAQYKNLSDEEFREATEKKALGMVTSQAFEERIKRKLEEFEEDYDLSDMKINDRDTLRALIQAQISLEDYEQELFLIRSQGISDAGVFATDKISKMMSDLRADISKLQNDLDITRKVRKSDKEASALAYISSLQEKARRFYESKMSYIFCPKCNMLLGTIWTLYPNEERNKISLICGRVMPDGKTCGEKIVIGTKELVENRGTNKREITPESML